jgi:hypothetical protein
MVGYMTLVAVPRPEVAGEIDVSLPEIECTPTGPIEWRVLERGEAPPTKETVETLLRRATLALDELADINFDQLDAETTDILVVGTEGLRRAADAAAVSVAGHLDQIQPFRALGFFNTTAYLKHRVQLSGQEAYQRVQMARQCPVLDRWIAGLAAGLIGTAQFRLMARIASNQRIQPDRLVFGSLELWCDALDCSFAEFERRALLWESLADPVGALAKAERAIARRSVSLTFLDTGGWSLQGRLDDIGGAEFNEVFAHFVDVEWRNDWREATDRLGESGAAVTMADLRRTEAQRRCDALIAMARSAAANGSGVTAGPTVNFLIDHDTVRSIILDEPIDPARYRDVVSRTTSGIPAHPRSIVNCAMWAHVRRVVTDAASVVIDMGRRSRLFTGPAREAIMLLEDECAWIGCDRPTTWCDADHSLGWKGQGPTAPNNGGPLCRRHNVVKEQGYRVIRAPDGTWHTYAPSGDEIL